MKRLLEKYPEVIQGIDYLTDLDEEGTGYLIFFKEPYESPDYEYTYLVKTLKEAEEVIKEAKNDL